VGARVQSSKPNGCPDFLGAIINDERIAIVDFAEEMQIWK